jgi:hypothetical protein
LTGYWPISTKTMSTRWGEHGSGQFGYERTH